MTLSVWRVAAKAGRANGQNSGGEGNKRTSSGNKLNEETDPETPQHITEVHGGLG